MINNVYWVGNLNVIGGVETAIYEIAKSVSNYDFVVYYNSIPKEQLKRLKKYVKCVKYNGEKIKCKKMFMNYDISIIDNVEAEEYIQIIHCVFKYNVLKPHTHNKITKYYAVGIEACESFKEITGKQCEVLHNPLQIDKPRKILKLISATRLASDKGKICQRMQKLVDELEKNDIPYEWQIFTNGQHLINGKGIIYRTPTLNIRDNIANSDYLVQLSDTEAFCYSVLESLYLNVPVIVTPIPCFNEMRVENGKNGYILDFDMKNIPVLDIYNNIPKFEYQPMNNEWLEQIIKVKSNYKEEKEMKVKVKAKAGFERVKDAERSVNGKIVYFVEGEVWETDLERAEYLQEKGVVEILKEEKKIEEPKKDIFEEFEEKAKKEEVAKEKFKSEEKPKKKKTSKK
jgi:glycosyltransferase involved in cell wall biosynthesis